MKVIKITPRGYCHGVVSALQDVAIAMNNKNLKQPIYILGEIVHNQIITEAFAKNGVITLNGKSRMELLDTIDSGTVIITAHGASYKVIEKAKSKGLDVIDATCADVYKTHNLIKEKLAQGYEILYIGKENHPEPEGAMALDPGKIHLITSITDVENLKLNTEKLIVTNQTTMSMWDTIKIIEKAKEKFPEIEVHNEICLATQQRQEAVFECSPNIDLLIVVGDKNSNNTNRLAEIAYKYNNVYSIRINSISDLNINELLNEKVNTVGITSGASTPTIVTTQVIKFVENFDKDDKSTWIKDEFIDLNKIIPRVKNAKNK